MKDTLLFLRVGIGLLILFLIPVGIGLLIGYDMAERKLKENATFECALIVKRQPNDQ